jgi:hypothetical protein
MSDNFIFYNFPAKIVKCFTESFDFFYNFDKYNLAHFYSVASATLILSLFAAAGSD